MVRGQHRPQACGQRDGIEGLGDDPRRAQAAPEHDVDRLVDAFFGASAEGSGRRWVPPMDLVEAEDHFVLKADLPGLTEDDVSIEIQDGTLKISGERRAEHEAHEKGWYRIERSFG